MHVPTMAELFAGGQQPEVLFWVGCAGSFDQRAQKITRAFATILNKTGISYAILKNEYPALGGNYEVIHHTVFLQQLIDEGKIKMKEGGSFRGKRITYHDSCYLGRANDIYEAPRKVLEVLDAELVEMKRCRSNGLCCGAGGAQMFKEEEKGTTRINFERTNEAIATGSQVIAAACPFCNTMLTDGLKNAEKESETKVMDIAELIAASM